MAGFNNYMGQIVTLTTADDQVFKGIVCSLDENTGKIVLKKASTDGLKLPGLQNFFVSNVKELSLTQQYKVLRESDDLGKKRKKKFSTPLRSMQQVKYCHLNNLLPFDSDQLVRSYCKAVESGDQGTESWEDNETIDGFYEEDNYTVFCQTCEKFRESIVYLMNQNVIALIFLGTYLGRRGTLSLIQVATKEEIFLYDILRLGTEGFKEGLQALLESNDVLKVIHDCRMVSDLLYHHYQVSLVRVFDTQLASAFVFRSSNNGNWPRFVESLPGVLMAHLRLGNKDVHHFFVRERLKQRDEEVWLQRPLCTQLVNESLKNLVHMIPLYRTLQDKMVLEFHVGVQLYLNQVRNAPKHKVDDFRSSSHILPFIFQDLPEMTKRFTRSSLYFSAAQHKGSCGFVNTCPRLGPNMVTTSRDSIWHCTDHFCRASCKCGSKTATMLADNDQQRLLITNSFGSSKKEGLLEKSARFCKNDSEKTMHPVSLHYTGLDKDSNKLKLDSTENASDASSSQQADIRDMNEKRIHKSATFPSNSTCLRSRLFNLPSSPQSTGEMTSSACFKSELNTLSSSSLFFPPTTTPSNQSELVKESTLPSSSLNSSSSSSSSPPSSPSKPTTQPSLSSSSSNASCLIAKLNINSNSNPTSPTSKTVDDALLDNETPGKRPLAFEKSALFKLGAVHHPSSPVSCDNSQSMPLINQESCDDMTEQGMDEIYKSDIVQKILQKARKGRGQMSTSNPKN